MAEQETPTKGSIDLFIDTMDWDISIESAIVTMLTVAGLIFATVGSGDAKDQQANYKRWLALIRSQHSWTFHYVRMLKRAEDALAVFFGRPWRWRAFDRCLLLACAYPLVLLLIGWAAGGDNGIARLQMLPAWTDWRARWPFVAGYLGCMALMAGLYWAGLDSANLRQALKWLERRPGVGGAAATLWRRVDGKPRRQRLTRLVCLLLAGAVAGAVVVVVVVAGAVAVAVAGAGAGAVDVAVLYVVIFMFLPVANAAADFGSWAVSRWLLAKTIQAAEQRQYWRATRDVLADASAALFFLALIAGLLPVGAALLNAAAGTFDVAPVDWRSYLAAAVADPFSEGLFVTAMLLTTLLPTLAHAFAALFLFGLGFSGMVTGLRRAPHGPAPEAGLDRAAVIFWFFAASLLGVVVVYTICAAFYAVISANVEPFGLILADIACLSGGVVEGLVGTSPPIDDICAGL